MRRRTVAVALVLAISGLVGFAEATMSNDDVVKLTKSGLSDDFVLNVIDQQGSRLNSDVSSLIDLKQNGVNKEVISSRGQEKALLRNRSTATQFYASRRLGSAKILFSI